jgi:hypothetical protein
MSVDRLGEDCAGSASGADEPVNALRDSLDHGDPAFAAIAYQTVFLPAPAACCCSAASAGSESS